MPTPSIQTLRADAQQVLNLDSISAVRSVVAATLANANAGTPLNPNLTTQQLWNEFYQIVTQPKSDIESIIANQLMKFLFAPPAPGGVGADKQVIFNDGGVLAGDAGLTYDKATDSLTVGNSIGIREAAINGIALLSAVTTAGMPATSGTTQSAGSLRLTATNTTGCLDIGTAGAVSWLQACRRTNLADNFDLVLNPNGGNLGIGVTPSAWGIYKGLQVGYASLAGYAGSDTFLGSNAYFDGGAFRYIAAGLASSYRQLAGGHQWSTAVAGANPGDPLTLLPQMTLDASGNLSLANGNLVMGTSGKGIDFSATPEPAGMTSELLSDYEEGTFTATLKGTVSDPTTPVTTTARYTKIGRVVTVTIQFSSVTTTGASGRIQIDGLPFTNNSSLAGTGSVGFNGMATFTGSPFASLSASSSTIAMFASNSAGAYTAVTFNAGTTQDLWTSLTYTV